MTATVRMSADLESLLNEAAKVSGKHRSQIIREALSAYCELLLEQRRLSIYDLLTEAKFEPLSSGLGDLSVNAERLRKVMNERADRRSS